jgi:hypothetical protein
MKIYTTFKIMLTIYVNCENEKMLPDAASNPDCQEFVSSDCCNERTWLIITYKNAVNS